MKSLFIIPAAIALFLALLAGALTVAGVHVRPADAIASAVIAIAAALLGILPITLRRASDPAGSWLMALAGTVIHLLVVSVASIVLILSGIIVLGDAFPFWMIGAYWLSLLLLAWRLRLMAMKVQPKC